MIVIEVNGKRVECENEKEARKALGKAARELKAEAARLGDLRRLAIEAAERCAENDTPENRAAADAAADAARAAAHLKQAEIVRGVIPFAAFAQFAGAA